MAHRYIKYIIFSVNKPYTVKISPCGGHFARSVVPFRSCYYFLLLLQLLKLVFGSACSKSHFDRQFCDTLYNVCDVTRCLYKGVNTVLETISC